MFVGKGRGAHICQRGRPLQGLWGQQSCPRGPKWPDPPRPPLGRTAASLAKPQGELPPAGRVQVPATLRSSL